MTKDDFQDIIKYGSSLELSELLTKTGRLDEVMMDKSSK